MSNSRRNRCILKFRNDNVEVRKLVEKLKNQRKLSGLNYTLLNVAEREIIILEYPAGRKGPRLSEFENFKSIKAYKAFTELNDVIRFDRKQKTIKRKKSRIRTAQTKDNNSIYWIKYI